MPGLYPSLDIPDPFWNGAEKNLSKWTKELSWLGIRYYISETTLKEYMYQEKTEDKDLPALKTALTHRYNDSRTA